MLLVEGDNHPGLNAVQLADGFMILSDGQLDLLTSHMGYDDMPRGEKTMALEGNALPKLMHRVASKNLEGDTWMEPCSWNMLLSRRCAQI